MNIAPIITTVRSENYKHANTNALTSEIARILKKVLRYMRRNEKI